jgi:hypothetical protein
LLQAEPPTAWGKTWPGLRGIHLNATIHGLLGGGELNGVKLTEASEFSPMGTTGALRSFHPDARYT